MAGWAAVKIDVQGWGMEDDSKVGWIKVNGQTLLMTSFTQRPLQDRGTHVICLQKQEHGYIMTNGIQKFDTHGHNSEAEELIAFLTSQPDGTIIVATSADDFTSELKREARKVLQDLGAKLKFQYRSSFALVAVKGEPKRAVCEEKMPGNGPARVEVVM